VTETPYIYSTLTNNKTSSDTTTESNNKADALTVPYNTAKNNCKSTQSSGVKCVNLTLVVTGSQSVCQAFIDDICAKPAIRITGFDWSKVEMIDVYNEETGRYEQKDPGTVRLTVSFNLYMADVADYSTAVSDSAA
jgi:hypothetical protein